MTRISSSASLTRRSCITIRSPGLSRTARDTTMSAKITQHSLMPIDGEPPFSILDFGCGPGRDLSHFRSLRHEAVGLDGSQHFVAMARSHSQCEVFHQDFLAMQLPESRFDGVFANASLFHVPSQELPRVLLDAEAARCAVLLKSEGEQRGGLERWSLCLLLRFRHLARLRHLGRLRGGGPLLPPAGAAAGINNPGSRPFGARASPPGRAVPPIRPAISRL